jgi:CBS domain containing-hemolysin-like protein
VTSLVVGFIAEPTLGRALEPVMGAIGLPEGSRFGVALTVGFVLATGAQMVFGELAPKNLAIAKPEPVARALAGSTLVFLRLASPLIRLFDGAANRLLRAVGIEPVEELHGGVSVEELDLIVDESAERGKLSTRQASLLKRAIDFGGLHASAAMVPWNRVTTVRDDTTCEQFREGLLATAHSRFPVVDETGEVVGLVHAKYLLRVDERSAATTPVASLAAPALALPETARLRSVLTALRGEATEMALVVDEYGAPAGVITLEDLVEELVGDIADEYDTDEPHAEQGADGSWTVPGAWRIDEVERTTGVALPADAAYDTLAGLVLTRHQRIPAVGDRIEAAGAVLEVARMDGWAVTRVRITPAPEDRGGTTAEPDDRTTGGPDDRTTGGLDDRTVDGTGEGS